MKIGIVADTHSKDLPAAMMNAFKSVDFIIHAGDFCSSEDLQKFQKIKTVQGVYGNMDDAQIRQIFPRKQILKLDNCTIGLFHGEGPPRTVLEKVKKEFSKDDVDCIVFGHSHIPVNETIDGVLYFNPGSPNDLISAPSCSYGILEINQEKIRGTIVKVAS